MTPGKRGETRENGSELRLCGVTKMFGRIAAVRDLRLTVAPGEFVTLLGASGSGKTTTLMILAGFTSPTAGEVLIGGADVTALPPNKRNLGVVFQNYSLFPHLTVEQNLAFPLKMRRMRQYEIAREVRQALELVQLPEMGKRYPQELSGGQQQRVALARAIIFKPQALLMDEPLGALDKKLREHMQMEIKRLHAALGATVLLVTHDQEEALTMSDRVAVMQNGSIAQIASTTEIYEQPANQWVAEFIGQSNFLNAVVRQRHGDTLIVELENGGCVEAHGAVAGTPGEKVYCVLRPERIRVLMGDKVEPVPGRSLSGTVEEIMFLGHTIKLGVRLPGGALLKTQASSGEYAQLPEVGMPVQMSWDMKHIWLVRNDGGHA